MIKYMEGGKGTSNMTQFFSKSKGDEINCKYLI